MKRTTLADEESATPLPRWVDGFLSESLCNEILDELEVTLWKPSTVSYRLDGGKSRHGLSRRRRSETAHEEWFSPELKLILRQIEKRIARLLGLRAYCHESWQALRYGRGDKFMEHFDVGHGDDGLHRERERSIVIYLNSPDRGGSTTFRELGLKVEARCGRLLTWKNLLPNGEIDLTMLHASAPVVRGIKTVLVTWVRPNNHKPRRDQCSVRRI